MNFSDFSKASQQFNQFSPEMKEQMMKMAKERIKEKMLKWFATPTFVLLGIALGAVIRGATPHADLINSQVSKSLAQVAIARGVPVINGVICADNIEQAVERAGTKAGNKGWDGAQAAMEMASLYRQLG